MERTLLKEVNKTSISARLKSKNVKRLVFPNFFSLKKVSSLKFETLVGEKGVPVMADVISYDAKSPLKTRKVVEKLSGDIPKTGIKRNMTEGQILEYEDLRHKVRDRADLLSLLDLIFNDLDFVYNGVNARMEWLSMQAMSLGAISLTKTNNAGGLVTEKALDYQIPSDNKSGVATAWSDAANAKPIDNLEAVVDAAEAKGIVFSHIVMRKDTFKQLKYAADTKSKLEGWVNNTTKLTVTKKVINEYLIANELPPILVVNPSVQHESTKGNRTIVNPWAANRVSFITSLSVGTIQHAPIAAEGSAEIRKVATLVKRAFVLVTKWAENEPYSEWTKAEANAFPVIDDPTEIYLMRTDQANWA